MISLQRLVLPSTESSIYNYIFFLNVKCTIFADLFYKDNCEINNMISRYMLTKGNVSWTAFKALKW